MGQTPAHCSLVECQSVCSERLAQENCMIRAYQAQCGCYLEGDWSSWHSKSMRVTHKHFKCFSHKKFRKLCRWDQFRTQTFSVQNTNLQRKPYTMTGILSEAAAENNTYIMSSGTAALLCLVSWQPYASQISSFYPSSKGACDLICYPTDLHYNWNSYLGRCFSWSVLLFQDYIIVSPPEGWPNWSFSNSY